MRNEKMCIQHKALPNAEVNVLPQDDNVNVVTDVVAVLSVYCIMKTPPL